MKKILIVLIVSFIPLSSFASNVEMKETLVQIIDAFESIKTLVNKAEKEQEKNLRNKVHFSRFRDSNGTFHNGLRDDLLAIQNSLIETVNESNIEPRNLVALENDFVRNSHG